MILLLDTSTPTCRLSLVGGDWRFDDEWQSDRELAKGLLAYIRDSLESQHKTWTDIQEIGVFEGPGSFTGLRIGLTVANTLADSNNVPIVGARGANWQNDALKALSLGHNQRLVMPFYGSEPHITVAKK